jgi:hypothetical protein
MSYTDKLVGTPPPEVNPPLSEEDRRPNDRPFYIDDCCPTCGEILIYDDVVRGETNWESIFFDEFACPKCNDGCHMDWTSKDTQDFKDTFDDCDIEKCVPLTEEKWAEIEALIEGVEIDD